MKKGTFKRRDIFLCTVSIVAILTILLMTSGVEKVVKAYFISTYTEQTPSMAKELPKDIQNDAPLHNIRSRSGNENMFRSSAYIQAMQRNLLSLRYQGIDAHPLFTEGLTSDDKTKTKTVLFWNRFYLFEGFDTGLGRVPFKNFHCDYDSCEITHNRNKYNQSDLIIFHLYDTVQSMFPLPTHRRSHQRWIFFSKEAPVADPHMFNKNISRLNGIFNLTMSYRLDSDVPFTYGSVRPFYPWEDRPVLSDNIAKTKSRLVCHFSSHCPTHSKREDYVAELQKYIQVDVYGKCGSLKCGYDNRCIKELPEEYKFRLAFENSICRDYATEKLFSNVLTMNIVPIVRGGFDTHKYLPPKSYIDTRDYRSPKELADYLKYLDKHDDEYNKYFEWKNIYTVSLIQGMEVVCTLCKLMHTDLHHQRHQVYHRLDEWWSKERHCLTPYELDNQINLSKIF